MKSSFLQIPICIIFSILVFNQTLTAQIAINTDNANPDASAMLDIKSTDKGILVPRMTTTQRNNISNAATGLLVFDTDTDSFWFKDTNGWVQLVSGNISTLADSDSDTKIQVEESADEDVIRFDLDGTEVFRLSKNANGYTLIETPGSGGNSTLYGQHAGESLTTGVYNTIMGKFAGRLLEDGIYNTFLGSHAGNQTVNGSRNTFIGRRAGGLNNGSDNVFIGHRAGEFEIGDSKLFIHNNNTSSPLIYGEFDNNLIRINGTLNVNNAFSFPTIDGTNGQILKTDGSGTLTWADDIGTDDQTIDVLNLNGTNLEISLEDDGQATQTLDLASLNTDTDDQTIDVLSLNGTNLEISLADDGQPIQTLDLSSVNATQSIIEDADSDTKIQVEESADEDVIRFDLGGTETLTLSKNANGIAGLEILNNNENSSLGENAGTLLTTGEQNTLIGFSSGSKLEDGKENVMIGSKAGELSISGNFNTYIGKGAGKNNTGNNNTFLGQNAGAVSSGSGNVFIGKTAGHSETGSNKLYIENTNSTTPLIYGEFDNDLVRVNGRLELTSGFSDADNDTKIQVEESTDEDIIRFDIEGNEAFRMEDEKLILLNTSFSTSPQLRFIGPGGSNRITNEIPQLGGGGGAPFPVDNEMNFSVDGNQTMSLRGDGTIQINNTYTLPSTDGTSGQVLSTDGSGNINWRGSTFITDTDDDTKIQVEESADEDIIRFDIAGTEYINIKEGGKISVMNSSNSVYLGQGAGTSNTGSGNTAIGGLSLSLNTTGTDNVMIGYSAGRYNVSGSGNVFIGPNAGLNELGSNKLIIDNQQSNSPFIYGEFDSKLFRINGDADINGDAEISGKVGIGTSSPSNKLTVSGNADFIGNVGIGTSSPSNNLTVSGDSDFTGKVGIGTASPSNKVEIVANVTGGNGNPLNYVAKIRNSNTTGNTEHGILALQFDSNLNNNPNKGNWVQFFENEDDAAGNIESNGNGNVQYNSGGSDYAEMLERLDHEEAIDAGEIVGVFGGKISKQTEGADWVMAISDQAIVLGNTIYDNTKVNYEIVSFIGQVPVFVQGKVNKGDYIIASGNNDGTAIAVSPQYLKTEQGKLIVGRAWEAKSTEELKRVNTVVGLPQSASVTSAAMREVEVLKTQNEDLLQRIEKLEALLLNNQANLNSDTNQ